MYHRVSLEDCLSVATKEEAKKLQYISDIYLLGRLANRWCKVNGFILGGYLGGGARRFFWDSTSKEN